MSRHFTVVHTPDAHSIKSKELVAPTVLELHYIIKQVKPTIFENATLDRPKLPKRNARPLTEDQNNAVIEKYRAGVGIMKLSKEYAVDPSTLSRMLRSWGVPPQQIQRRRHTVNDGTER